MLAFGREFRALETDDPTIIRWIESTGFYLGMTKNFPFLNWYPFSRLIRRKKEAFESFVSYAEKSVELRREANKNGTASSKPVDLLQAFIDAEDPESEKVRMTPHEVSTESIAMQLAGSESTSFVVCWVLHLLTLYPKFFNRAVDEYAASFRWSTSSVFTTVTRCCRFSQPASTRPCDSRPSHRALCPELTTPAASRSKDTISLPELR